MKKISLYYCYVIMLSILLCIGCKPHLDNNEGPLAPHITPPILSETPPINSITSSTSHLTRTVTDENLNTPTDTQIDILEETTSDLVLTQGILDGANEGNTPIFSETPAPPASIITPPDAIINHEPQVPSFLFWHTNKIIPLSQPSNSFFERYIERTPNGDSAIIDMEINDPKGNGKIWLVGAQAVRSGNAVQINPQVYGKNTNNILFNWVNKAVGFWPIYFNINVPIPLVAPIQETRVNLFPNDPGIVYMDGEVSKKITIYYREILKNTTNINGAGSLYKASAWNAVPFHSGDQVEIVIYMYTTKQDFKWYLKTVGLNPSTGIPKALGQVEFDHLIELQRFPLTLE